MATTGEVFGSAAVTASEAPWSDNDWTTPTNVFSDNAATANVTATSFDSPDQTFVLKVSGFDFSSIPDGSTINGITARINAWFRSGQGSGSLDLCQLLDATGAKVGTNQCATPVALSSTVTTIITKGSASDLWGNALDAAWVKDPDFGIALGILATAANADVDIDYVTLEIDYTAPVPAQNSPALELSSFGTFTGPDADDTITNVIARINVVGSSASLGPPTYQLWDGATAQIGATQTGSVSTDGAHIDEVAFGACTSAQLSTLRLRIYAHSGTASAGATVSVDYASLTVTYVPVTPSGRTAPTYPAEEVLAEGTGTRAFPAVTTQAGDHIVVMAIGEDGGVLANLTPTATGLTFTLGPNVGAAGDTRDQIWTAPDAAGGSRTVTMTPSAGGANYRAHLTVVRGSDGPGTGVGTSATAQSVTVTRQDDNSGVFMAVGDWSAGAVGSPVWTPGGSTVASQPGTGATYLFGRWDDSGAAGTAAHGISSPSYTTPSIAVLEMLGTGGGGESASGSGLASGRTASTATGVKTGTGSTTAPARTASAATGAKSRSGSTTATARTSTAATGRKQPAASTSAVSRTASAATGRKQPSAATVATTRTATAATGVKRAAGTGTATARTASAAAIATSGPSAATITTARTSTTCTGIKGAARTTTASARTTAVNSGAKRGVGAGIATGRSTTTDTGRKHGTATGTATAHTLTTCAGTKRGLGSALATARTASAGGGVRQAVGVGLAVGRTQTTAPTTIPVVRNLVLSTGPPGLGWMTANPELAYSTGPPGSGWVTEPPTT